MIRDKRYLAVLLAVSAFIFFFRLGDMALTDPDETFYAETAREMLGEREWVTPLIFGEAQFEKPILFYWLVEASYGLFGVNEFAARLPSVLFGLAGVIGVYLLGRLLFSSLCGLLSGLVFATCVQSVMLARACVTDMTLTVFILFCLLFFLEGWKGGRKAYYLLSSCMAAFAVLTKGPVGVFIPAVIVFLYLSVSRQWKVFFREVPLGQCALIFFAVCLPWHIIVTRIHGAAFINEFLGFHNVMRFLEPEHSIGDSPFFYVPVVIGGFFPWTAFLPLGAWDLYKRGDERPPFKDHRAFVAIWFLAVFIFFTVSRTKLVTYIFPLYPVMALITGRFWERYSLRAAQDKKVDRYMRASYSIYIFLAVAALVIIYLVMSYRYVQALGGAAVVGAVFTAGSVVSLVAMLLKKRLAAFASIVITVVLMILPITEYVLPTIEEFETSKPVSFIVSELAGRAGPIGGEADQRRGIAFYTRRPDIADIQHDDEFEDFISRKEQVWCIIKRKHYERLKDDVRQSVSEPLFRAGKKVVVTNRVNRKQ